ncbi:hypothetical protein I309_02163 [Cryptococcus deuterogattii LA55]|nr:hypothetical protein I309_02163 [Cryptococcus deuterogattii LA55]KIR93202.1 hypothetical protein I304_02866 [Cryptococcus deuterogattii CBS 10090]
MMLQPSFFTPTACIGSSGPTPFLPPWGMTCRMRIGELPSWSWRTTPLNVRP